MTLTQQASKEASQPNPDDPIYADVVGSSPWDRYCMQQNVTVQHCAAAFKPIRRLPLIDVFTVDQNVPSR